MVNLKQLLDEKYPVRGEIRDSDKITNARLRIAFESGIMWAMENPKEVYQVLSTFHEDDLKEVRFGQEK